MNYNKPTLFILPFEQDEGLLSASPVPGATESYVTEDWDQYIN